jgi:hypothetical protein
VPRLYRIKRQGERGVMMTGKKIWKEVVMDQSRYYPAICLEKLRKTMKRLSKDCQYPGQDLKQAVPKYVIM